MTRPAWPRPRYRFRFGDSEYEFDPLTVIRRLLALAAFAGTLWLICLLGD